jgi:hypothetical protein
MRGKDNIAICNKEQCNEKSEKYLFCLTHYNNEFKSDFKSIFAAKHPEKTYIGNTWSSTSEHRKKMSCSLWNYDFALECLFNDMSSTNTLP